MLHTFGAFFDGAKNAAAPNLTGKEGLLAGTALIFSTRFLLMAVGSALGGRAAAVFGYEIAFLINASDSFLVSAFTVWLIPEEATRDEDPGRADAEGQKKKIVLTELREGFSYAVKNRFRVHDPDNEGQRGHGWRLDFLILYSSVSAACIFAVTEGWNPDMAVALLWTATGLSA